TLVEYYIARDEVMAFVVTRSSVELFRRLCTADQVGYIQKRLSFHLEEFTLGDDYLQEHADQSLQATQRHLGKLYNYLFAPIAPSIRTNHVTIVPHGCLHLLPFHAFTDGSQYLLDQFDISYAPSASVLKYCIEKPDIEDAAPFIVGVPDELA